MSEHIPVTQKDIAERLGISVMTVSRALSDKGPVNAELKDKIVQTAKELGYKTNPLVSSLMRCRSQRRNPNNPVNIGWFGVSRKKNSEDSEHLHSYDPYLEYFRGAKKTCEQNGYKLDVFGDDVYTSKGLIDTLKARGMLGVILGPKDTSRPWILEESYPLHVVQIGRSRNWKQFDRIVSDSFLAMRTCVRALREQGATRIGYIDNLAHVSRNEGRWEASFGYETRDIQGSLLLTRGKATLETSIREFMERFQPEALVIGGNAPMKVILSLSSPPPFVAINRNGLPDWISGSEPPHHDIGAEAARRLIDAIQGPQQVRLIGHSVSLSENWHEGSSHVLS